MPTYSKVLLSASTNGRGIKVNATSTAGDTIHAAVSGASDIDEIYIYAVNAHTAAVTLTLEWGGTTDPDDLIEVTIPHSSGLYVGAPGLPLQNSLEVAAFASVADVISIFGFVNRITA